MAFGSPIFVSHCGADQEWTRAFVEALRWSGSSVWVAEQGHPVGPAASPDASAEHELTLRRIFIAVMSPSALLAQGVARDVRLSARRREMDRERVTLVVLAQECRVPRAWYGCEVLEGVNGAGILPQEAARRVGEVLAAIPQRTVRTRAVTADNSEEALTRAKLLETQGRSVEALAAYDHALALDPTLALAWCAKGNILMRTERHEDAIAAFDEALALDAELALAWHGQGLALAQLEQPREALEAQERALELDPALASAWSALGAAQAKLGKHDDALDAYERALELDARQPQTWRRKGDSLQQLARAVNPARGWRLGGAQGPRRTARPAHTFEEALEAYDEALALAPHYLRAWNNKIHLLDELGRPADAAKARRERQMAILGS